MCAAVLVVAPAIAADNPPAVRPLTVTGVKFDHGKAGNHPRTVEIKTDAELRASALIADATGRAAVAKQVSFEREKLVVFVWSGSGQDTITGALSRCGGTARFAFKAGDTNDLRRHGLVFAVPRAAKVVLVTQ